LTLWSIIAMVTWWQVLLSDRFRLVRKALSSGKRWVAWPFMPWATTPGVMKMGLCMAFCCGSGKSR